MAKKPVAWAGRGDGSDHQSHAGEHQRSGDSDADEEAGIRSGPVGDDFRDDGDGYCGIL